MVWRFQLILNRIAVDSVIALLVSALELASIRTGSVLIVNIG